MAADANYQLWLHCGGLAAAMITLATEFIAESDDSAYLSEVQHIVADLQPIELALTAAWLGNFAARALLDAFSGDMDNAREELQRVAVQVAQAGFDEL